MIVVSCRRFCEQSGVIASWEGSNPNQTYGGDTKNVTIEFCRTWPVDTSGALDQSARALNPSYWQVRRRANLSLAMCLSYYVTASTRWRMLSLYPLYFQGRPRQEAGTLPLWDADPMRKANSRPPALPVSSTVSFPPVQGIPTQSFRRQ